MADAAPSAPAGGVPHISGAFAGQMVSAFADPRNPQPYPPLLWTLSLTPRATYPSAFGASYTIDPSGVGSADAPEPEPRLLEGKFEPASKFVHLREAFTGTVFSATLTIEENGEHWLKGIWERANDGGSFAVCFESNADVVLSGMWLGEANPAAELAEFYLPVNPIVWNFAAYPALGIVFGAGFFDDSADVPNKPVLFYTLSGTCARGDAAGELTFNLTKRYTEESAAQYSLPYEGTIAKDTTGSMWAKGKWSNPTSGGYGPFAARLQPAGHMTPHIALCTACSKAIFPGECRWSCPICVSPAFAVCGACHVSDAAFTHPHYAALVPETAYELIAARGRCTAEIIKDALVRFAARPFLGSFTADGKALEYATYGQIASQVSAVAAALQSRGAPRSRVLVVGDVSPRYVSAVLGPILAGMVLVPVYGSLPAAALAEVLARVGPALALVEGDAYAAAVAAAAPNLPLLRLETVLDGAGTAPPIADFPVVLVALADPSAILYTSGTTGAPKGSLFSESLLLPSEGVSVIQPFIRMDFQSFDPTFVLSLLSTMHCGGARAFARSLVTLLDDMAIARPTHLGAAPSFWASLQARFVHESRRLLASGLGADAARAAAGASIRAALGNRLFVATSGGAPLSADVIAFAKEHLRLDLTDLYGSRETGGIARDGVVYKGVDVALLSVPELGYYADGAPPARGEICVHSPRQISGYVGDAEGTAEKFVDLHGDGRMFYRTGDIGEIETDARSGQRRIRILDRAAAVIKLASGEWLSPQRLEGLLEASPFVRQAAVLALPDRSSTYCVLVPSTLGAAETDASLVAEVAFVAAHHHLRPMERPATVLVDRTVGEWSPANGLLTATEKKRRTALAERYLPQLGSAVAAASAVSESAASLPPRFAALLQSVLPSVPVRGESRLAELGGDSLAAAMLLNGIEREYSVRLPVAALFEHSLAHLARLVSSAESLGSVAMGGAAGGGHDSDFWAEQTALGDLASVAAVPPSAAGRTAVLVTGCTGFLGPVLVERTLAAFPSAQVYCLVRGADVAAATAKLTSGLAAAGLLSQVEGSLARMHVLCGDLAAPRLGLSDADHKHLASVLRVVIHSGAAVDMFLPYAALAPANVGGTRAVAALALASGARLVFVSTIGAVNAGNESAEALQSFSVAALEGKGGYGQSKAVAEEILRRLAVARPDLDLVVVRPSAVGGHVTTGWCNKHDFTVLLLGLVLEIGAVVPDARLPLRWVPVDFVAGVIAEQAAAPPVALSHPRVFNLFGQGPLLCEAVALLTGQCGHKVSLVSAAEWRVRAASAASVPGHALFALRNVVEGMDLTGAGSMPLPPSAALGRWFTWSEASLVAQLRAAFAK